MELGHRTCLSLRPSSNTCSIIVNLGISPSATVSLGSQATRVPRSKAEPACRASDGGGDDDDDDDESTTATRLLDSPMVEGVISK